MNVLTLVRHILIYNAGVTAARNGDVWPNWAKKDDPLPNLALMVVGGEENWTHQGQSGLIRSRVRIWCRAKTAQEAGTLGAAVGSVLNGWKGQAIGFEADLIARVMFTTDYEEGPDIHREIMDFDLHWRALP